MTGICVREVKDDAKVLGLSTSRDRIPLPREG